MSVMHLRTIDGISTYASVVTSPATCTRPVVTRVSTATRLCGSSVRSASRMLSEIWSQILSGCPSVTDSDVKRRRSLIWPVSVPWNGRRLKVGTCAWPRPKGPWGSGDHVENALGHRQFRAGSLVHYSSGPVDDHDVVTVCGEALSPADPVEDQVVAAFAGDLLPAELEQPVGIRFGLRGEPDDHLGAGAVGGEPGEDVRIPDEFEDEAVAGVFFPDLAGAHLGRAVIGDGSRHDHHIRGGRGLADRLLEFERRSDGAHERAGGRRHLEVGRDERHRGAAPEGGLGQGDALFAAGPVAEEPHRVERFAGSAATC